MTDRPLIALALGDPAGIGLELAIKALSDEETAEAADFLVIGDRRHWDEGVAQAGTDLPIADFYTGAFERRAFLDLAHANTDNITVGEASEAGGRTACANFRAALKLAAAGGADAVCFTPFNKAAMRMAEADYVDEIGFVQRAIDTDVHGSEFNVLDEVWNARVTSHIPLSEVASALDQARIERAIKLTHDTMEGAGIAAPKIGVAALNPHAGDGGNFGREDDEIILPAVEAMARKQYRVTGPVPSDTAYVRALKGEFDAVLTMYHDQGQIAIKLIGFHRGVTLIGGYPFWIATPAHGTAYDIAGQGIAHPGATINALRLAARLCKRDNPAGFPEPYERLGSAADVARDAVAGKHVAGLS